MFVIHEFWKQGNICNTWIMKTWITFFSKTWIMKIGKYLQYTNYENIKIFVFNTWIMKTLKYLLTIHELWKHEKICLQYMNYENMEMSIWNTWIWNMNLKHMNYENICLQYMNYEKIYLQNMNYENRKILFCNTLWNFLFAKHELWKNELYVCNTWIMKNGNVCLQYMNYENRKILVCNTWTMKICFCK